MPEYSDIFVITDERDSSAVKKFLDHFLPKREHKMDLNEGKREKEQYLLHEKEDLLPWVALLPQYLEIDTKLDRPKDKDL